MAERYFTLDQAQELVPWLAEAFRAMSSVRRRLDSLNAEVDGLEARLRSNGGPQPGGRLAKARRELEEAASLVAERVKAIQERGILVKSVERGLVDFPSLREERAVYLCWEFDEPEIGYWHEVDSGFAGRRPL